MNDMKEMNKKITRYTIVLGSILMILGTVVFRDIKVGLGLGIGAITGLIGYFMIVDMALNISEDEEVGKKKGISNYYVRLMIYALVFSVSVIVFKIHILSLLLGILAHKVSIYIYSIVEKRKGG